MPLSKRLTKRVTHELGLALWEELAETGKTKKECSHFKNYQYTVGCCSYCEYSNSHERLSCKHCPIRNSWGGCGCTAYSEWDRSSSESKRKRYAKEFLEQLKQIDVNKPWTRKCLLKK